MIRAIIYLLKVIAQRGKLILQGKISKTVDCIPCRLKNGAIKLTNIVGNKTKRRLRLLHIQKRFYYVHFNVSRKNRMWQVVNSLVYGRSSCLHKSGQLAIVECQ